MVVSVMQDSGMNGGRENLFKAISSNTRLLILERLSEGDKHISGLARELGISVPVTAKHVKVLEKAELIEREKKVRKHSYDRHQTEQYLFFSGSLCRKQEA